MSDSGARPSEADSDPLRVLVARYVELFQAGEKPTIEELCADQPDLIPRVRNRLKLLGDMGLLAESESSGVPERLGEYHLLERLGEGAMGVVYLAEQTSLGRRVALKLVRPEHLFFARSRQRFRREVEVVARLQHPGIIPIHAVGEEDGVPYFAMELVGGCSLEDLLQVARAPGEQGNTRSGEQLRRLVERAAPGPEAAAEPADVELFRGSWTDTCVRIIQRVAEALDHAHRRGVIHRDIKPSNVMLTAGGRVLLMDFGLASAEGAATLTQSGSLLGSVAYMAPEVLRGQVATSRSDLYSLGVTLYQLLTRRLPFAGESPEQLTHKILAASFVAPRRLEPAVPWEVETVCLTAMDPSPERRYASAADMARDLGNTLARRPIEARRPGALLRSRRWIQRRPALAIALLAGFLIVVVGPLLFAFRERATAEQLRTEKQLLAEARDEADRQRRSATDQAIEAARQRDLAIDESARADRNLQRARLAVDEFLDSVAGDDVGNVPHLDSLRRSLLSRAIPFYEGFLADSGNDPRILRDAAHAEGKLGKVYRILGDMEASRQHFERSADYFRQLEADENAPAEYRFEQAMMRINFAEHRRVEGEVAEAISMLRAAIELLSLPRSPDLAPESESRVLRALAHSNLAQNLQEEGDLEESVDEWVRARTLCEDVLRVLPGNIEALQELGRAQSGASIPLGFLGRREEAEATLREAIQTRTDLVRRAPGESQYRADLALSQNHLAWILSGSGPDAEAVELLRASVAGLERVAADHPLVASYRWDLAQSCNNLGSQMEYLGELDQAHEHYSRAEAIQRRLVADFPSSPAYRSELAGTLSNQADYYYQIEEFELALDTIETAIELQESALEDSPRHPLFRQFYRIHLALKAQFLVALDELEAAGEAIEALVEHFPVPPGYRQAVALLLFCAEAYPSRTYLTEGEVAAEVERLLARAVEFLAETIAQDPTSRDAIREDSSLTPLREREDYREVMRGG